MTETTTTETKTNQEEVRFSIKEQFEKTKENVTKRIEDFNEKYVDKYVKDGREAFDKQYKKFNELVEKHLKTTKESVEEYRKSLTEYLEGWKKYVNNMPVKTNVEKRINQTLDNIPKLMNLPGKKDIDNLIADLEALNTKVDALAKKA